MRASSFELCDTQFVINARSRRRLWLLACAPDAVGQWMTVIRQTSSAFSEWAVPGSNQATSCL
jgi:hypothetical protein